MPARSMTPARTRNPFVYPDSAGSPAGSALAATILAMMAAPREPPMVRMLAFIPLATPVCPPPDGHFREHPERPVGIDYIEGWLGNALLFDFLAAFERSAGKLWTFVRREDAAELLVYNEDLEEAAYRVRLYRGTAREITMDLNASVAWRQWWLSGPLRVLKFKIAGSYSW